MKHSANAIISKAIPEILEITELTFKDHPRFPDYRKSFLRRLNDLKRDLLGATEDENTTAQRAVTKDNAF